MLYQSLDRGTTFEPFEQLNRLPSRERWHFFHPPFHAGHVHGIAIHPARPERVFAGVEQGGLLFTHDGGATWRDALPGYDLHRIGIDPADPDHLLAGAGEGLFVSHDAGLAWQSVPALVGKYIHAVVSHPERAGVPTAESTGKC